MVVSCVEAYAPVKTRSCVFILIFTMINLQLICAQFFRYFLRLLLIRSALHILLKHATFLTHKIWKWLTPPPAIEAKASTPAPVPSDLHYNPIWSSPPSSCFPTSISIKILYAFVPPSLPHPQTDHSLFDWTILIVIWEITFM